MRQAAETALNEARVRPQCETLGRLAALALYDELALSPKPGLVTLVDTGSHRDMDARTFLRSISALRGYFMDIAWLGATGSDFIALQRRGIEAEGVMLRATGGVNTHRGAIFMLGLLCAAAGSVLAQGMPLRAATIRSALVGRWAPALLERAGRPSSLPGGIAARRYGLRGAPEEAAAGFPALFETALPALHDALTRGMGREAALLDTLFHVMAILDDSNLAHRGGIDGLRYAQKTARAFLETGGAARRNGFAEASRIGTDFVRRNLSPGGAADTLSATCWLLHLGLLDSFAEPCA